MLIDTVAVISRRDEVDVVTVAATGMAGDAIQDLGAIQEVADVLLERCQGAGGEVDGHRHPAGRVGRHRSMSAHNETIRLYSSGIDVRIRSTIRSGGHGDIVAARRRRNVQDSGRPSRLRREDDDRGGVCERDVSDARVESWRYAQLGAVLLSHPR